MLLLGFFYWGFELLCLERWERWELFYRDWAEFRQGSMMLGGVCGRGCYRIEIFELWELWN